MGEATASLRGADIGLVSEDQLADRRAATPALNPWGNLSEVDVARIQSGELTDMAAVRLWTLVNPNQRINLDHPFLPIVRSVCPEAERRMKHIVHYQDVQHSTAVLELSGTDEETVWAKVLLVLRKRIEGANGQPYFLETGYYPYGEYPCREMPAE